MVYVDTDLMQMTVKLDRVFERLLDNPSKTLSNIVSMKKLLNESRLKIYEMIAMHFGLMRNSDGGSWKPLTGATEDIKSRGISRFSGPFLPAISTDPLKGSEEYFRDLTTPDANALHGINETEYGGNIQVGSDLPQAINEVEHTISPASAIIALPSNNPVPPRQVLYMDLETEEDLIDMLDEHVFDIMSGKI